VDVQGEGLERHGFERKAVVTEANKDRIRAGVTGHNVRYVVVISCALVIVAFIIIYAVVWR
jgi:hypothetical protein